jgi:hypothetical protein
MSLHTFGASHLLACAASLKDNLEEIGPMLHVVLLWLAGRLIMLGSETRPPLLAPAHTSQVTSHMDKSSKL